MPIFTVFVIWAAARQNWQNGMCTQRRLRSAWASAQSDQSLCCALYGWIRTQSFVMRTAKTLIRLGECPGWSVFAGRTGHFVGFVMLQLILFLSIFSEPNKTKLVSLIQPDIGGMLPRTLVDTAIPGSMTEFFSELKEALQNDGKVSSWAEVSF